MSIESIAAAKQNANRIAPPLEARSCYSDGESATTKHGG